jgi:hypothetical protein
MDVTIRNADAKKSNEVFPNKDHKIAKKNKKNAKKFGHVRKK